MLHIQHTEGGFATDLALFATAFDLDIQTGKLLSQLFSQLAFPLGAMFAETDFHGRT